MASADLSHINLGVNEQITLPAGYYPNDITISNNVINRGSNPVVVTSANATQTLPSGYYDEFVISTDITNVGGTVKYRHHVHSTTSADEYVETDTATPTTNGLNDNYSTQTAGGCFTTPRYETIYNQVCYKGDVISVGSTVQTGRDEYATWRTYRCRKCGHKYDSLGGDDGHWHSEYAGERFLGYFCSCGRTKGQVVEAIISY